MNDTPSPPVGQLAELEQRYLEDAREPVQVEVARRQLERLRAAPRRPRRWDSVPSIWRHAPLEHLFTTAGNILHSRADGTVECGHEPMHASRGGRCVVLTPGLGRWYCRSWRTGGDAATFVIQVNGWDYPTAAAWLSEHYGPPHDDLDIDLLNCWRDGDC
jgi:hypothetical protein